MKFLTSPVKWFGLIFFPFIFFASCILEKSSDKKKESLMILAAILLQSKPTTSAFTLPADAANNVVDAPNDNGVDFRDKTKAINGVRGNGCCGGSLDVFSLSPTGSGAHITLEWIGQKVINGSGIDFVVFENPFQYNNNPSSVFMEAIIVEVSIDGINFCGFSPDYNNSPETTYSTDPSKWLRFAGKTPVFYTEETNQLKGADIYDPAKAGGDGFDLSNLLTSASTDTLWAIGCSASLVTSIQNNGFYYVRLTSASDRINPDTSAKFLRDSGASDGPDIDGVFARYRAAR